MPYTDIAYVGPPSTNHADPTTTTTTPTTEVPIILIVSVLSGIVGVVIVLLMTLMMCVIASLWRKRQTQKTGQVREQAKIVNLAHNVATLRTEQFRPMQLVRFIIPDCFITTYRC